MFPTIASPMLTDGWGEFFRFVTNDSGGVMVYSLGADKEAGGDGTNSDTVLHLVP